MVSCSSPDHLSSHHSHTLHVLVLVTWTSGIWVACQVTQVPACALKQHFLCGAQFYPCNVCCSHDQAHPLQPPRSTLPLQLLLPFPRSNSISAPLPNSSTGRRQLLRSRDQVPAASAVGGCSRTAAAARPTSLQLRMMTTMMTMMRRSRTISPHNSCLAKARRENPSQMLPQSSARRARHLK